MAAPKQAPSKGTSKEVPADAKGSSETKTDAKKSAIEVKVAAAFAAFPRVTELWHDGEEVYFNCRYANCVKVTRK